MQFRTPPVVISLSESGQEAIPNEVQLTRVGTFYDYFDSQFEISQDMLKTMVKNFTDKVRGIDLAIDYSHENWAEAAGWIKSLSLKNNDKELWAEVKWTPSAAKKLADGEYRYLSAEFHTNYSDNENASQKFGPTLFGAGLTNRPFVKRMEATSQLSENKKGKNMNEQEKKIAELEAQIKSLSDSSNENAALKAQLAESTKREEEAKKLSAITEKKASFDKMFSEGKVVEAQREAFMNNDTAKFAELAVKTLNTEGKGTSESPAGKTIANGEDAQKKIIELARKLLSEKQVNSLSEGIRKVLADNKELSESYHKSTSVRRTA